MSIPGLKPPQLSHAVPLAFLTKPRTMPGQSGDSPGQLFTAVTTHPRESQINSCGLVLEMGDVPESTEILGDHSVPRSFVPLLPALHRVEKSEKA